MRLILTFSLLLILKSCKVVPEVNSEVSKEISSLTCPVEGTCKLEVIKNSHLEIKTDEFGILYPQIDDGLFMVLKFEYIRNEIPETADSGYRELIFLQLNPEQMEMEIQNKNLSTVNLLFARLCFCRGQTGYYKINMGRLSVKKIQDKTYLVDLEFKTDEVPQVINHISETFKL